jgi:signal transduction histidine kinase
MIEHNIELTRKLTRSLHPLELGHEGLPDALRELAASVSSNSKTACAFECSQNLTLATVDANMHLYRIAQEAINLAVRHGRARNVKLALKAQAGTITLSVMDDGLGPPADADDRGGLGLQMMRYRAGMIDAVLQVESLPGGGCRVTCSLPDSRPANTQAHAEQK